MLWLNRPADVTNPNIKTVRVVRDDEDPLWAAGVIASIAGWGDTDPDPGVEFYPADLMEATVPMRSDVDCFASYGYRVDLRTMVCAGEADPSSGSADACYGDSGGPLLVSDTAGHVLVGVVSWGEECNLAGFPGVYSRIGDEPLNGWVHTRREAGPPDVTAPVMALGPSVLKLNRAGRIPVRLTCPASEPRGCAGTVTISTRSRVETSRARRFVTFGRARFNIRGGATADVTVNPSARNDALIRRLRSVSVKARVYASDDYGQVAVRTFLRTLRALR